MSIYLTVKNGQLIPLNKEEHLKVLELKEGEVLEVKEKPLDKRTVTQNSSLHKYFELVAIQFNKRNLPITIVLKPEIMWNKYSVKELIWKVLQKPITGKESTTKLKKDEITKVYDVMNKLLGERFGFNVEFPNKDKD